MSEKSLISSDIDLPIKKNNNVGIPQAVSINGVDIYTVKYEGISGQDDTHHHLDQRSANLLAQGPNLRFKI